MHTAFERIVLLFPLVKVRHLSRYRTVLLYVIYRRKTNAGRLAVVASVHKNGDDDDDDSDDRCDINNS